MAQLELVSILNVVKYDIYQTSGTNLLSYIPICSGINANALDLLRVFCQTNLCKIICAIVLKY